MARYASTTKTGSSLGTFTATGTDSPGTQLTLTIDDPTDLALTDNAYYWWRVRATDGSHPGAWSPFQRVFYNPTNDAPTAPLLTSPLDTASVSSLTPVLVTDNSSDADDFLPWGDITLRFEVFSDPAGTVVVTSTNLTPQGSFGNTSWVVNQALADNTWFWWSVTAIDTDGLSTRSSIDSFFVNTANDEPTTPSLISPVNNAEVNTLTVALTVGNATDPEAQPLTYFFEWASSPTFSTPDYGSATVPEAQVQTTVTTTTLTENTTYWWRVRASDGYTSGPFVMASFFVNATNDAPGAPIAISPSNGSLVDRDDVVLTASNATDPDINDTLTYHFQIYKDLSSAGVLSGLVDDSVDDVATGVLEGLGTTSWDAKKLKAGKSYYWVATAIDDNGLEGAQSVPQKFETLSVGGGSGCSVTTEPGTSGLSMMLLGLTGLAGVVVLRRKKA